MMAIHLGETTEVYVDVLEAVTQSKAHTALPQAVYRLLVLLQCPVP